MLDRRDLEPVFFAPFVSSPMRVEPAWIDYNGHLNMAYYNVLFDRAVDEAFELIGCGLDYVKRMHFFEQLFHASEGWVAATSENMSLHVDMTAGKTVPFPDDVARGLARMKASHANLPRPEATGRRIAMPGKS